MTIHKFNRTLFKAQKTDRQTRQLSLQSTKSRTSNYTKRRFKVAKFDNYFNMQGRSELEDTLGAYLSAEHQATLQKNKNTIKTLEGQLEEATEHQELLREAIIDMESEMEYTETRESRRTYREDRMTSWMNQAAMLLYSQSKSDNIQNTRVRELIGKLLKHYNSIQATESESTIIERPDLRSIRELEEIYTRVQHTNMTVEEEQEYNLWRSTRYDV